MVRAGERIRRILITTALVAGLPSTPVARDAELEERTIKAWVAYVERAEREFNVRPALPGTNGRDQGDSPSAGPANEDGIIKVPGGLVHHWRGIAVVPGRTLEDVVAVSRAYADYPSIYRAVTASTLIEENGDTVRVQMRVKESAGGLSAVLDIRSTVRYLRPAPGQVDIFSSAEEIREVRHAGEKNEYQLPAGKDSGYLWRANTLTRLVQVPDGVRVEMETLGLSRGFPPLLGWIIEPIARRLGRRSVEETLREFVAGCLELRSSRRV